MESKSVWMSRTMWVNLIMGFIPVLKMFWPDAEEVLSSDNLLMIFSVVNLVLRSVTKGQIEFK